jgi:hypothetical protein
VREGEVPYAVARRVGLVARAEVDAALGRRLVRAGRAAEHRAVHLRILVEHLARRVGASELGGDDPLARAGARPLALLARLGLVRCRSAPLLARALLLGHQILLVR